MYERYELYSRVKSINLLNIKDNNDDDTESKIIDYEHVRWFRDSGDTTLRLNYDLNENSIVLDFGGYKGEWTNQIINRYNSNVYIFEPIKKFYDEIVNRFKNNDKVKVFNYGLSNIDKECPIILNNDGSSEFINNNQYQKEIVFFKNVSETLNILGLEKIDLLKINIEGGEYNVISNLIETGIINKINNLQVQFHSKSDGIDDYITLKENLYNKLSISHNLTWCYHFCWENWKKKL